MNLITKLLGPRLAKGADMPLTNQGAWTWLSGEDSWAKVRVGADTQLQISAAFSSIRLISETVGIIPLHLYRRTSRGREKAMDDPRYGLVHDQPNEYMTAVEWKEAMAVSLCTMGQAYNYTTRMESTNRIVSIQPVHKSRVEPQISQAGDITYRLTKRNGAAEVLKRAQIGPIRGFGGVGDLEGYAPHKLHGQSMALTVAVEKYGAEFFGSGARPTGVLSTKADFKETSRDSLRASFAKYMRESWLKGELPVLDSDTTYTPVTTPNNEAQFIETRKLQVAEIARIYRVPLHMLMEMDKASYSNTEQANKHFLDYTLMPYLSRIEQSLNSCFLSAAERKTLYFQFDVRGLLRGDSTQRAAYYVALRNAGAISQNEIRELEDMPTVEGADDLLVPLNMAPSDLLRSLLEDKQGAT